MAKEPLIIQTTTLWDYPSQHYDKKHESHQSYTGATPSYIIWNLLLRYTKPKDLIVDPMCGSGTTLEVARDLERRALGYDIAPICKDIFRADARKLPLETEKADFVFIDPPYSDHVAYSQDAENIGNLSAQSDEYYLSMQKVISEINRILRKDRYMALYVSDSFEKKKPFMPIGFRLFSMMSEYFEPVDIISVIRHNSKLQKPNWRREAAKGNFYLRGFNYLFIMYKKDKRKGKYPFSDRRDPKEWEKEVAKF